ncbi:MAG: membrane dipeptidase [Chloroflexia bacterium]|nr:membrane dipeptidase [Chloroflexia bacterium]
MSAQGFPPVFDGHNDTILSLNRTGRSFFEKSSEGHLDLPRAKEGGVGGGFFAVYIADRGADQPTDDALSTEYAQSQALSMLGKLIRLEAESQGQCKIVRTATEIQECMDNGTFAILLHIEGAEPLDAKGDTLEVFYAAGLRSVGITHSRSNIFGHGVTWVRSRPDTLPASPDTGPGLTDAGKDLVRHCNKLGVMIDLSHLNEKGFWDVAALSEHPLVATHSNVHALSSVSRNLTDKQLNAIKESNGVVGLNYAVSFLREDGQRDPDNTPVSLMVDHIDYLVDKLGINGVALGSDYDGTTVPSEIGDAAGQPVLIQGLRDRGYDDDALAKLAHRNWVRVLRDTWGS